MKKKQNFMHSWLGQGDWSEQKEKELLCTSSHIKILIHEPFMICSLDHSKSGSKIRKYTSINVFLKIWPLNWIFSAQKLKENTYPWIKGSDVKIIHFADTVEPWYKDPRYKDIPGLTINVLCPGKSYSEMHGTPI